jgi:hypothetical protein
METSAVYSSLLSCHILLIILIETRTECVKKIAIPYRNCNKEQQVSAIQTHTVAPYSGPLPISRNLPIRRQFHDRRLIGSLLGESIIFGQQCLYGSNRECVNMDRGYKYEKNPLILIFDIIAIIWPFL